MGAGAHAAAFGRRAWDIARSLVYELPEPLRRLGAPVERRRIAAAAHERLKAEISRPVKVDHGAALLAAPFAMVLGSALYLGLEQEPPAWPAWALALSAGTAAFAVHRKRGRCWAMRLAALLAFAAGGFALTDLKAQRLDGPRVPARQAPYAVEGWVEEVDAAANGRRRYTVRLTALDGEAEGLPKRVRMTAPLSPVRPGDPVRARAVLSEPAGPPVPGAYDFSRRAYFDELGGSGYALGRLDAAPDLVLSRADQRAAWFAGVRASLADRLRMSGGQGAGGVLAALVTGDRSEIDPDTTEALRVAGLGHILAISGMHLALVGGGVFFALSWLFAAIDPLARRCNPRKLAAAGALGLSLVYLTISGAETPTQRAFIMAAVAFGAILADRRALTLRGVAIAALAVLLLAPESGVTPGFQMSFAASTALVAFNDYQRRRARMRPQPKEIGAIGAARRFLFGLATTSLIAGTATAPFAAYHFNRFAGLGYFANFLAMPVFTVGVMPFAAIAGLLAPFGLEAAPAWVSARSIDLVTAIAEWTAAQPGAITPSPAAPPIALALAGAAFVAGAVLRQGRPLVVTVLACLTVFAWRAEPRSALWIGENGGWLAQSESGDWVGDLRNGESYGAELFLRRVGAEGAPIHRPSAAQGFRCDASGCAGEVAGLLVAVAETWAGVIEDCGRADVVFTPGPPPDRVRARCGQVLLAPRRGRDDRGGVLEDAAGEPALVTARGAARPWRPEARGG